MNNQTLITGSSGFIGSFLKKKTIGSINLCNSNNSDSKSIQCDLINKKQTYEIIGTYRPKILFHLAGKINPQKNEEEKVDAYNKNFITTNNIVNAIKEFNLQTHLIFLSTDKVYDEINQFPSENDALSNKFYYGKLKHDCEILLENNIKKYHILRVPIVHANGDIGSSSFIDKSIIKIKNNQEVTVFDNIYRSFISIEDLTKTIIQVSKKKNYGIYNIGSEGISYYDRIINLIKKYDKNKNLSLIKSANGTEFPKKLSLNTNKIKKNYNITFN